MPVVGSLRPQLVAVVGGSISAPETLSCQAPRGMWSTPPLVEAAGEKENRILLRPKRLSLEQVRGGESGQFSSSPLSI